MKTIDASLVLTDPVIEEVRKHKREIAAAFGFDVRGLAESLRRRQDNDPRFVMPPAPSSPEAPIRHR